jgi:hypothetical protein
LKNHIQERGIISFTERGEGNIIVGPKYRPLPQSLQDDYLFLLPNILGCGGGEG